MAVGLIAAAVLGTAFMAFRRNCSGKADYDHDGRTEEDWSKYYGKK